MSQELLYTSAPKGLKPGSRGFCTVLSTQGMPAPLATAVEGLSGYRAIYPPTDERASRNPVVYSHLKMQAAGRNWHVLSRIADYGLDYSQRPNKLAHHVIVDHQSERLPGGPANLLSMPGFMRDGWEGEPKIVAPKPVTREPQIPLGVCQNWKDMTGDAGWAGVLAESFLEDPDRLVIILFTPGEEILPLFAESLSLLPVESRWDVTFSTYFTSLTTGTTCTWRAMIRDSKEAHESLRFVNALRIDLNADELPEATGGDLVTAARSGQHPPAAKPAATRLLAPPPLREIRDSQVFEKDYYEIRSDEDIAVTDDNGSASSPPPLGKSERTGSYNISTRHLVWLLISVVGSAIPLSVFFAIPPAKAPMLEDADAQRTASSPLRDPPPSHTNNSQESRTFLSDATTSVLSVANSAQIPEEPVTVTAGSETVTKTEEIMADADHSQGMIEEVQASDQESSDQKVIVQWDTSLLAKAGLRLLTVNADDRPHIDLQLFAPMWLDFAQKKRKKDDDIDTLQVISQVGNDSTPLVSLVAERSKLPPVNTSIYLRRLSNNQVATQLQWSVVRATIRSTSDSGDSFHNYKIHFANLPIAAWEHGHTFTPKSRSFTFDVDLPVSKEHPPELIVHRLSVKTGSRILHFISRTRSGDAKSIWESDTLDELVSKLCSEGKRPHALDTPNIEVEVQVSSRNKLQIRLSLIKSESAHDSAWRTYHARCVALFQKLEPPGNDFRLGPAKRKPTTIEGLAQFELAVKGRIDQLEAAIKNQQYSDAITKQIRELTEALDEVKQLKIAKGRIDDLFHELDHAEVVSLGIDYELRLVGRAHRIRQPLVDISADINEGTESEKAVEGGQINAKEAQQ